MTIPDNLFPPLDIVDDRTDEQKAEDGDDAAPSDTSATDVGESIVHVGVASFEDAVADAEKARAAFERAANAGDVAAATDALADCGAAAQAELEAAAMFSVPDEAAEPQPEDTPAEGYGPDSGPELHDDECPHGYFVGRGCPEGCVDDEGQRADEPPVVEAEAVFDADGNITEFREVVSDPEGRLPDMVVGDDGAWDDVDTALDEFAPEEEADHHLDRLLTAVFNRGWNSALDALGAKFTNTGAFLEVRAAIEKLRKE